MPAVSPELESVRCPSCQRECVVIDGGPEEVGPDIWMSFPLAIRCECGRLLTSTEIRDLLYG